LHDAVVLSAIEKRLSRELWGQLSPQLVGGRPGTSPKELVSALEVRLDLAREPVDAVRIDLRSAFASGSFEGSLEALARANADPRLLELLRSFRRAQPDTVPGLIEGSPVAPLQLAALLNEALVPVLSEDAAVWLDDGIMFVDRGEGPALCTRLAAALQPLGMSLHPEKTRIVEVSASKSALVDFLGFDFVQGRALASTNSVRALFRRLDELVARRDFDGFTQQCEGWGTYFATKTCGSTFDEIDRIISAKYGGKVPYLPSLSFLRGRDVDTRDALIARSREAKGKSAQSRTRSQPRKERSSSTGRGYQGGTTLSRTNTRVSAWAVAKPGVASSSGRRGVPRSREERRHEALRQVPRLLHKVCADFPELRRISRSTVQRAFDSLDQLACEIAIPLVGGEPPLRLLTFAMAPYQADQLEDALRDASRITGRKTRSGNLALMATDFAATSDTRASVALAENRARHFARLERCLGLRLVVIDRNNRLVYGAPTLSRFAEDPELEPVS
jgi:hypothetical protein